MISGRKLTKKYDDKNIFTEIDVKIGNGKKIGLVGRNGCGKSTLIKVLCGVEELTDGKIDYENERLGYIPQEFSFPDEMVGEYLERFLQNEWEFYKIETVASQLKFHNFDIYQEIKTLSEGQKMKIKLIETLLQEPTVLFIDEPTNHLDIDGILWFEKYIKHLPITVMMISHDRSFLNNVVDEIWEIENQKIFSFIGNYDDYKTEKLKLINKWDQEYVLFLKKKAQLEKLLDSARKIKDGKKRGKAISSAKKRIERETGGENKKEKYETKSMRELNFKTDAHSGKLMIRFENVDKNYGEKEIFEDVNFELRGKEKIWLFGPNGAGKSTLVKMIMNEEPVSNGRIRIGENLKIGYYSQVAKSLDHEKNLFQTFIEITNCFDNQVYGYLSKFLFSKDDLQKRVWQLSPGQRARFAFAIFAYKDYDMLILDEPDNHLDIDTKEVLERSLRKFPGAVLLVSHDRYFVESVGINKILNLADGEIKLLN
jgi:ATPase subunit of ABC transporter with duplicated ATPase domains